MRFPSLLLRPLGGALVALLLHGASLFAAPPEPVPGAFTLLVLPDTQYYTESYPETYLTQGRWIAANVDRYAMRYVLHVGDVTDNNVPAEWKVAREAHAFLAGKIPCAVAPGNHDLGAGGKSQSRETLFSEYFPLAELQRAATFGGVYDREPERTENTFHLFEAGGRKWLIITLEFGPRNDVVRWAGEVAAKFPERSAILLTHAYLRPDNTRFDRRVANPNPKAKTPNKGIDQYELMHSPEGYNDGEDLWRKLVSPHRNFVLVLNGHQGVGGHLESTGEHGQTVQQVVVDYQNEPNGGGGFLRLLQFLPDGRTVRVNDYSPVTDETVADPSRNYDFVLPANPVTP